MTSQRNAAIDILRGLVMVIMALDRLGISGKAIRRHPPIWK
jgi:uncharacterized membrane protein